jgi:hypothetical protein
MAEIAVAARLHTRVEMRAGVGVGLAGLAALIAFSIYLAETRIYQVDECQNVFVARLLHDGQGEAFFTGVTLYVVPLMALVGRFAHAVDIFNAARLFAVGIFWLNLVLLAIATGERLFSRRGLIALCAAATMAPLWDYGFEIRHDNLLLTGLLLMWLAIRASGQSWKASVAIGALAVVLEFVAFKAFVYTIPLSAYALLAIAKRQARRHFVMGWLTGALLALAIVRVLYGATGLWSIYARDFRDISSATAGAVRFPPWRTLARVLVQTPLLVALTVAAAVRVAADWSGRRSLDWRWPSTEVLFLVVTLAALLVNPVPYPYNLLNFVPFLFLFCYRYAATTLSELPETSPAVVTIAVLVLGFTQLLPFAIATRRHLDMSNDRQREVMRTAEALTDAATDPVYDGVGMVPTRRSIHREWFLHSLNIEKFSNGTGPTVREMLAANPAPVIIQSYRTDWLPAADHAFIRGRYLPLSDDLWVLGAALGGESGEFPVFRSGRYRFDSPNNDASVAVRIDGTLLTGSIGELSKGRHGFTCEPRCAMRVRWVGPTLQDLPVLSGRDHASLFVNWY